MNLPLWGLVVRKLFRMKLISGSLYCTLLDDYLKMELQRIFGGMRVNAAIYFTGYEDENILLWTRFPCKKVIFVHSDMEREIRIRGNQRRDVLHYAYNKYDKIATVTMDLQSVTMKIKGTEVPCNVCHNMIDYKIILKRASKDYVYSEIMKCTHSEEALKKILAGDSPKFVSIGRFSPEKNHALLIRAFQKIREQDAPNAKLVIIGGNQYQNYYNKTVELIRQLNLSESVILILSTPNPFNILKQCDYFALSSEYEGFGLVLTEADILGKPVISTDITGPRLFMQEHGGTLVENSVEGVYQGMKKMLRGQIKPMNVDYEAYNRNAIQEFENLFS